MSRDFAAYLRGEATLAFRGSLDNGYAPGSGHVMLLHFKKCLLAEEDYQLPYKWLVVSIFDHFFNGRPVMKFLMRSEEVEISTPKG